MKRQLLLLFGGLLLATPAAVQAQFSYTVTNNTITLTGYTGTNDTVAIPSTINGLPVTAIGHQAFYGSTVTSVMIPVSVTSIGEYAFSYCSGLTNIMVDPLNPSFSSVDGVIFNHSQTTLVEYPAGKVEGYTIPNSVTSIADRAFAGCYSLTSVTIPNSVTSIGDYGFFGCMSLTNFTVPDSVTIVGDFAFFNCFSLTNITLGSGVTSIGASAFSGDSKTGYYGCHLVNVIIPNSVTNIGSDAFFRCPTLINVTIPSSVTTIGDGAFAYTSGTNIMVDPLNRAFSSVDGVLFNHDRTTLVQYPGGKVGDYTIPNGVTHIGDGAFEVNGLSSVVIPNSVTNIGSKAFFGCGSLTNVTIPNSVTSIADSAFAGCYSLTTAYFQGNAPSLDGTNVFYGTDATAYYLPGATGWGPTFGGVPTALWTTLPSPLILSGSVGVRSNQFGFTVSWALDLNVVVEAVTDLANPIWASVQTNKLTGGSFDFRDQDWTNHRVRFYRVRPQ